MVISPAAAPPGSTGASRNARAGDRAAILSGPHTFRQFVWLWNVVQRLHTPELHTQIARWLEDSWER
ncbi:MAG TPA: hypothetical protein ENJ38_08790, partial [Rhodospirillales bacterium]|nr:hypothetical protein [Rhodospirillales bacterium]